jgi:hypothetical protein
MIRHVSNLLSASDPILDLVVRLHEFTKQHALVLQSVFSSPNPPDLGRPRASSLPPANDVERLCTEWSATWSERLSPINEACEKIRRMRALDEVWESQTPGLSGVRGSSSGQVGIRSGEGGYRQLDVGEAATVEQDQRRRDERQPGPDSEPPASESDSDQAGQDGQDRTEAARYQPVPNFPWYLFLRRGRPRSGIPISVVSTVFIVVYFLVWKH